MMDIYDQILENLELERDLGTRTVEIDRALLIPPKPAQEHITSETNGVPAKGVSSDSRTDGDKDAFLDDAPCAVCDILFLSGRPLSVAGQEAIQKTIVAMKKIKTDVSVRLNEDVRAKVIVLLGSDALKKLQPNAARPIRGRWMTIKGIPTLPTFSPDYIFSHFQAGSPSSIAAKRDMWNDIKAALARL